MTVNKKKNLRNGYYILGGRSRVFKLSQLVYPMQHTDSVILYFRKFLV